VFSAIQRMAIKVRGDALLIQVPFREEINTPISGVARVIEIPTPPHGLAALLYRTYFALMSASGSTLALLPARSYKPESLDGLLARLPQPERGPALTLRQIWRQYKPSAPVRRKDVLRMVASYALTTAGLVCLIVGGTGHR
jgi:hypothetical protein